MFFKHNDIRFITVSGICIQVQNHDMANNMTNDMVVYMKLSPADDAEEKT